MKKFETIRKILSENKLKLTKKFYIKEIAVFGSYIRQEQKKDSDLDILVEFSKPVGFFKFLDLEEYLEKLVGVKIDLVSKKALKPLIGKKILEEMIRI